MLSICMFYIWDVTCLVMYMRSRRFFHQKESTNFNETDHHVAQQIIEFVQLRPSTLRDKDGGIMMNVTFMV